MLRPLLLMRKPWLFVLPSTVTQLLPRLLLLLRLKLSSADGLLGNGSVVVPSTWKVSELTGVSPVLVLMRN